MSYASDHIFGFPLKQDEKKPKQDDDCPRGSFGWYEKRCKDLEMENLKLKDELRKLKGITFRDSK